MELTETQGVKAIMALQSLAGIEETEESARAGWNKLSEEDQRFTLQVYAHRFPEEVDA